MDLKVMPGKMTKLEKEANTYGQIHCVDVSTYKEVEWVQEKRKKCTSSFPKKAIEKTETVSRKFIFRADHPLLRRRQILRDCNRGDTKLYSPAASPKGQLISKRLFDVIVLNKKPFLRISVLASI